MVGDNGSGDDGLCGVVSWCVCISFVRVRVRVRVGVRVRVRVRVLSRILMREARTHLESARQQKQRAAGHRIERALVVGCFAAP